MHKIEVLSSPHIFHTSRYYINNELILSILGMITTMLVDKNWQCDDVNLVVSDYWSLI